MNISMSNYLHSSYNLDDQKIISVLDEISLWGSQPGISILDHIPYKKGMNVLDVGFGVGFPLIELAMRLGNTCSVYGLDPWKSGIARALQKTVICGVSNVRIVEGEAEKMPFENSFFDLVVSNNGLNNVHDLSSVLNECSRVMKPGGEMIFTFNTDRSFIEFYSVFRTVLKNNELGEYDAKITEHIYAKRKPRQEFERLLKDSGFGMISSHESNFHYRFSDGTAMLNHFFIKVAFLDSWKNILPEHHREKVFTQIEKELNAQSHEPQGLVMNVPFVTMECAKVG